MVARFAQLDRTLAKQTVISYAKRNPIALLPFLVRLASSTRELSIYRPLQTQTLHSRLYLRFPKTTGHAARPPRRRSKTASTYGTSRTEDYAPKFSTCEKAGLDVKR